jgi:phospholipid-transporting ATPase
LDLVEEENELVEEQKKALIITGDALIHIAGNNSLLKKLAKISIKCEAVLGCRVSPKQKASIVIMMKKMLPAARTLAIGDGANDVNMIIEAHIGIGIKGVEGQQAARVSDYSISEFKHLRKLLAVYGRESYRKNSVLVLYTFWKNIIMVLPQFWFALITFNFSGMGLYEKFLFQFVNTIFTAYPIILFAVLDIEVEPSSLLTNPKFYKAGPKKLYFNKFLFIYWIFKGLMHSFFLMLIVLVSDFEVDQSGRHNGYFVSGMTVFLYGIIIVNAGILVISNSFYFLNIFCILCSIISAFIGTKIFSIFPATPQFGNFETVLMTDQFFSSLVWCIVFITVFDYLSHINQKMMFFEFVGIQNNLKTKKEDNKEYKLLRAEYLSISSKPSNFGN